MLQKVAETVVEGRGCGVAALEFVDVPPLAALVVSCDLADGVDVGLLLLVLLHEVLVLERAVVQTLVEVLSVHVLEHALLI